MRHSMTHLNMVGVFSTILSRSTKWSTEAKHHLQPVDSKPDQVKQKPRIRYTLKKTAEEDWRQVEKVIALHEHIAEQRGMDYFDYLFERAENEKLYGCL